MTTPRITPLDSPARGQADRPTCVVTMIEELLTLASEHERDEHERYYWLSLRFLTYHIGISKLLQALAEESQQRIRGLIEVAASLPIALPRPQEPAIGPCPDTHGEGHFFIHDDEIAAQELSRALLEEWRSRRFYERLQAYNAIPDLNAWLNDCIGQCRAQFQILHEARYQCPGLTQVNAHTA